jgi:uncharacterized HAD superfamily protein
MYNCLLREKEGEFDPASWTQTYLIGMVSEMDEVLGEIQWKKHRVGNAKNPDRTNIALELADLTKYVLSLWEVWDFSDEEMLEFVELKSMILEEKKKQEFFVIPDGLPVLITDLDGTLCDWRATFFEWIKVNNYPHTFSFDDESTLMAEQVISAGYPEYTEMKDKFESSGMYANMIPYPDGVRVAQKLSKMYNTYIVAHTARPAKFKRIWWDSWIWLKSRGIPANELRIGAESRILLASDLLRNHPVIMFEDDPTLISRAANCGIRVFARSHSYNKDIVHKNVTFVKSYDDVAIEDYFKGV